MATTPSKDTIYIDIDDEITGIIDKLRDAKGKVVALVLPKRAAVLQSIVNMKLLKRAADESKKNVVLITAEAGLLPLAGVVGLHVAKTLTSKPEVPAAPSFNDEEETVDEDSGQLAVSDDDQDDEITAANAGDQPVGKLAGLATTTGPAAALAADEVETLELDDDDEADAAGTPTNPATKDFTPKTDGKKSKKDKKLQVPNFERFRLWLILGGLLFIILIGGLIYATSALPKATITIKTDASNVSANLTLNLSTATTALDATASNVPAKAVTQQKTYTQQATATGQKNNGQKATGSVTMTAQVCGSVTQAADVPAGTGVSANGLTYITQVDTSFSATTIKNGCINFHSNAPTAITAQTGGANYNSSAQTFTVAGRSDVTAAVNAAPSGGTDDNIQIVSQSDIDGAKNKITTTDTSVKAALQSQLSGENLYPIAATYVAGTPTTTTSANAGDQASSVTVTETVVYSMLGVQQADLKTLIDNSVKNQIDTSKQSILSEGLDTATYSSQNSTATTATVSLSAVAVAGPQLNVDTIKKDVAGKKPGEIRSDLQSNPDVTSVDVKLSPFWVTSVPKKANKVTVTIAKPTTTASSKNATTNP